MKKIIAQFLFLMFLLPVSCAKRGFDGAADYMLSIQAPAPEEQENSIVFSTAEAELSASWNEAAYSMLKEVYAGESFVISPLCFQTVLSMILSGCTGETAGELRTFLRAGSLSNQAVQDFCNKYLRGLPALDLSITMRMLNALVYSNQYEVNKDFSQQMERLFYAPCVPMDFSKSEEVLEAVNDWCAQSTDGRVPSILSSVHPDDVSYLLGSILFKATLNRFFLEGNTAEDNFYISGDKNVKVQMMHAIKKSFLYGEETDYRYVSIPVGEQGAFNLTIVLPQEGKSLDTVLEQLGRRKTLLKGERSHGEISLPRYKISTGIVLNDLLKGSGVRKAFTPSADYTLLRGGKPYFYIGEVRQNAVFSIDENGIDAAAITMTSIRSCVYIFTTSSSSVIC